MGKLKRAILVSFRTKVIVPVVGVMVLLMATSMWLINQRVARQMQADAAQQLATADALLQHFQKTRMDTLLASYRKAVQGETRFKSIATLFDPDQEEFSDSAQRTTRAFLDTLIAEKFSDVITMTARNGQRLTVAADAWVKTDEFETACSNLVDHAITGGATAGTVKNTDQLLDVVAVPIRVKDDVVAVIAFGVKNTLAESIRTFGRTEVLLSSDDQVLASTARERELQTLLTGQISPAKLTNGRDIQKTLLNNEHYLCLTGTLKMPVGSRPLGYLILSSYENPWQVLRETQQTIVFVSVAAIFVGMAIVWIYVRRVTEPLEDLREHTEAIGKGDFTRRVELNSRDEFGDLAEAFNQMTENLKISRQQLETTVESLKSTQAQLIQSEKLSGIGEFVAGVAHELNNPLTTVMGFSELLQQSDADPQHKRQLEMVHKSAVRCQKIVQNLLSFSRRHKPERKLVCLNSLVEAAVEILAYQLRTSNIEVVTQLDPKLPEAMVDSHQLQQVFINILNNARQAMEAHQPKGCVRISTLHIGDSVKVVFRDNGPGIRKENLSKLFDPFFTTKEIGKGTGLGLSICYGIVKEHGGTIVVQSEYGEGAAFIIELPVALETDSHSHNPVAPATTSFKRRTGKGKSVLVIDDEETILQMVGEVLTRSGYQVDVATDGESALRQLNGRNYDLAVCDWKMPGLNGPQFYERLRVVDPKLAGRLIFMTGDVINQHTNKFLTEQKIPCIAKPFALDEFEAAISDAIPVS